MRDVNLFDKTFSVTEALTLVKGALKDITLVIQGEVTGIKTGRNYSAVYFSIKDSESVMPCLIWKNRYAGIGFELKEGMLVNLTGNFSVYTKKGQMSFDAFKIEQAGEGQLRAQVNKLIEKLQKEGLTDEANKNEIPAYPQKIGVVTSGAGAVIHDVLRTIRRRVRGLEIQFWGVSIEGKTASQEMANAIKNLDENGLDVILLVRGGGSFEDMMPFNDEELCRTIYESKTPVVTGIGHHQDVTVADLVSDLHASTPTAAAEIITQNLMELPVHMEDERLRINDTMSLKIEGLRRALDARKLKLDAKSPENVLGQQKMRLDFCTMRMQKLASSIFGDAKNKIRSTGQRLDALSPLAVLTRGYSYTQNSQNCVIKSIDDCDLHDNITVVLSDGKLLCEVKEKGEKRG